MDLRQHLILHYTVTQRDQVTRVHSHRTSSTRAVCGKTREVPSAPQRPLCPTASLQASCPPGAVRQKGVEFHILGLTQTLECSPGLASLSEVAVGEEVFIPSR